MADFMPVMTSNDPKINDHEAVEKIINGYYFDPELNIGVNFDEETGAPYLFAFGWVWPEAWPLPAGVSRNEFDPYGDLYEDGADGFVQLLKEIAPYLTEALTVQAVGSMRFRFPLSACEWSIEPGGTDVEINEFRHGCQEATVGEETAA